MNDPMEIAFQLNGRPARLTTDPARRAIDVLRDDFGLIATKEGCGSGECGACAVLLDGVARLSCLMLAAQLDGHDVTTAEGLGTPEAPHPVQTAFAVHGAVQCGYCSPGMTIAAAALLANDPAPDRGTVRQALSGNLCRCTGYVKIVDAVLAAAAIMRGEES